MSPIKNFNYVQNGIDSSDEESALIQRSKKRVQRFSESDTENENVQINNIKILQDVDTQNNSDSEPESRYIPVKNGLTKSRIKLNGTSSEESDGPSINETVKKEKLIRIKNTEKENVQIINDNKTLQDVNIQNNSDSEPESRYIPVKSGLTKSRIKLNGTSSESDGSSLNETVKNEEQQIRMKNKRNKLKDKFQGLLSSRGKHASSETTNVKQSLEGSHSETSDPSDNEMSSITKIKQKIKKSMKSVTSICDPDTSDEEGNMNIKQIPKQRQRKEQKSTKLIEPKPIRMSAKQAMENMQLIKSESNRMLREKAVSLPYHRPKALSLKDIMSRRKPAVTLDGKVLPIKMNEEQLKHYALILEQRQKEMMELCKSESDEETPESEEKADEKLTDTNNVDSETITQKPSNAAEHTENETTQTNLDITNDDNFDSITLSPQAKDNEREIKDKDIKSANNDSSNQLEKSDKNDSNTDFKLVYNDSVEVNTPIENNAEGVLKEYTIQNDIADINEGLEELEPQVSKDSTEIMIVKVGAEPEMTVSKVNTEPESQLISLHYTENNTEELEITEKPKESPNDNSAITDTVEVEQLDDLFSDDDVNMDEIDRIIENAEIMNDDNINSLMLNRGPQAINANPKIMGAPGMVIDLDGCDIMSKKLTGLELLKERFIYFSKLKTPEEMEREKEKTLKPGAQHLKLKHDLEEQIAEQRSLEWAKRLEEEKQQHMEMETILDDAEDSFEKIEAKLEENEAKEYESSSESEEEEELEENDIEIKDKPRKHNPMLDDEADESENDEQEAETEPTLNEDIDDENIDQEDDEEDDSSDDESSESEEETTKPKKGRILKAFEDSDDEASTIKQDETETAAETANEANAADPIVIAIEVPVSSQDDIIQLAQRHSASDDLFTSQESSTVIERTKDGNSATDEVHGTQTFSILDSTSGYNMDMEFKSPSKLNALCMSQPYHDPNLNAVVGGSQLPITQSSQSQPIGEDILALCTGKFYDNEFVSQTEENEYVEDMSQDLLLNNEGDTLPVESTANDALSKIVEVEPEKLTVNTEDNRDQDENSKKTNADGNLLKSILDELDDPEFDKPKTNKFFTGGTQNKENNQVLESTQMKKKFIIESDDDTTETNLESEQGKKKKLKKRKPEKRALHISDDEEEEEEIEHEEDEYMSDLEEDAERLVEYDSEENEIEVKPDKPKKKRKAPDFFEQEAELTSEDEWVGSGDEDEKGLDRMEREAGDDDVFHQGKLRRELGQIHMRDVLDQDKREVRIIQELLFEDGDLGDGHRQRKFRWRNAGEEDETGTAPGEFADTQEEEFESEEQWRKQRHEREVFLRQMQQDEEEGSHNVSVNRTTIIKANLSSKSMSTLLQEVNQSKMEKTESPAVPEKKTNKDIPSPKKSFSIFQQNYHGSLLTRGRGALARLAALATPLAADDDAPKIGSLATHNRNFVFTALTPDEVPKVTIKRKAEINLGTPKLVKKMRIEEKQTRPKSSLLDHLNL